jgi:hypothetical protein
MVEPKMAIAMMPVNATVMRARAVFITAASPLDAP